MTHVKIKSVRWKAKQIFRLVPLVITRNLRLPGYDGGRSVYTAMAHTRESSAEPRFVSHLLGALEMAVGRARFDCAS
jgi:hypothetical protein